MAKLNFKIRFGKINFISVWYGRIGKRKKKKENTYKKKEKVETTVSEDTDSVIYWWERNLVFKRDNEVQSSKQVTGDLLIQNR